MKETNLRRNPQNASTNLLQKGPKAGRDVNLPDISATVASVREDLIASRDEFATRAAKARKSLPSTVDPVMLG